MKSIIAKSVLKKQHANNKKSKFLSLFLAVIVSLGISFSYFGFQIISGVTPMLIIKLVLLFAISCILIYFLYTHKSKEIRFEIIERIMKFKPSNFILLVLCMFVWYSTIITLFGQVCISPDGVAQLLWFNNYTCFDPSSRQDLPNYWLSDHHPFIDTLIYGTFWKFGEVAFGDGITGMRLFIYIQALVWTIVLVYACFWIQKRSHNHATTTSFAVYVFMLINPLIPLWITCALKDISAMPFIMMWLMLLIDVVFPTKKAKSSAIPIILLIATSSLSVLMRKSTLVSCIFIVCGLACISIYRLIRKRKQLAIGSAIGLTTTIASIIISLILVPAIAYPSLNIAPSGPQESLSVPIQQTIGIIQKHKNEISTENLSKIEAVLPIYECLGVYTNTTADPVKDKWKRNSATSSDKKEFLKVWLALAVKYPSDAIKSCKYLFDYAFKSTPIVDYPVIWAGWQEKGSEELFYPIPEGYRTDGQILIYTVINKVFTDSVYSLFRIPLNLITYTVWLPLIIFGYVLSRKDFSGMTSLFIPYSFALTLITVAASQVRYAAPLMFFVPIIIGCVVSKQIEKQTSQ